MDADPGSSSVPSRWTPLVVWLLTVTVLPIVLLGLVWLEWVVGLPFVDRGEGVLNQIIPPVVVLAFLICLVSVWRSSSTVVMKILATLGTVVVLFVSIMMALVVVFWGFVTTRT